MRDRLFEKQVNDQMNPKLAKKEARAFKGELSAQRQEDLQEECNRLRAIIHKMQGQIVDMREMSIKYQNDVKLLHVKAKEVFKEKKKQWAKMVHESTLKRVALNNFPQSFSAATLKMHKTN